MTAPRQRVPAFTLIEVLLVAGLLAVLSALVIPSFYLQLKREELPASADQLRSLITLARGHAAMDGKRYRLRFPDEDEKDALGGDVQPIIEREDNPIDEPEVFHAVSAPWTFGTTLIGNAWCAEVRLGKPTAAELRERRNLVEEELQERFEEFDPQKPPLIIEVDGATEWATFVLSEAPRGTELDQLEDFPRLEVILDGVTGRAWIQRPLSEQEIDLFEEKNWPVVLGQDYTSNVELDENSVLELRDFEEPQ